MSKYTFSLRQQAIIQFVYDHQYPTREEILYHLAEKDLGMASRSFDRYLARIRADLGLDIKHSKKFNGYHIDEENSVRVESFFKYLELVQVADIFSKSLQNSNEVLNYVSFDDSKDFKGIENLKDILLALKDDRELSFRHFNYETEEYTDYKVFPILLKEYVNRWYVVGAINTKETRTFGIDRISNLKIGNKSKMNRKQFNSQIQKFEHTVGLTYGEGEPTKVVLLVDELHVKYMRSLPLHSSQIIYPKDKNNKHKVEFLVYPNYEFKSQILKIGNAVEVLEPKFLREEIVKILKKTLKKY